MKFRKHVLYGPWQRCVHSSCIFDTFGELLVARALDNSQEIVWWMRNDPAQLVIPTPAGNFEPDFLYFAQRAAIEVTGILEVKGESFYEDPTSRGRLKATAAVSWTQAANSYSGWEFILLGDQETRTVIDLPSIRNEAYIYEPHSWQADTTD